MVIPASHARIAHEAMSESQLEIFEDSGHMPFHDHPDRFVETIERFIDSTAPARHSQGLLGSLMRGDVEQDTTSPETESLGA